MLNTLADWLTYLESLHPKTIALGLERVAQVKQRLNLDPDFPIITVGGTNGKGSVCAMLESMLHAAGYRVGCYTSPHLLHYNERVRIGKQQVSDAELCSSFEKIEQARGAVVGRALARDGDVGLKPDLQVPLTYFEFGTLAVMQLFIEKQVEVAILEVGLGGRLDAVNVFDSDCAVVTSVDIDHTDYLGEAREQIAFEKAGIFRLRVRAVAMEHALFPLHSPSPALPGTLSRQRERGKRSGITAAWWVRAMRCRTRRCAARSSCTTPVRRWRRWMR